MTEIEKTPPAADVRYEGEDADEVARVFVRVEWKGGKVREYEALEPQAFVMNDPENERPRLAPMRMAVQSGGSPVVPMMAAVPELRLSFRANPRHNMHIRREQVVTVIRGGPGDNPVQPLVQGEASPQVTAYPGIPSPKSGSEDAGRSGALSTVSSTEHMGLEPDKPA